MKNKTYETIELEIDKQVAAIRLNRPDIHNAFNDVMIKELTEVFRMLDREPMSEVRVITLEGRGKTFCAGVDINWMRAGKDAKKNDIYQESLAIAECMLTINNCTKPTLAKVHGGAFGGACGLMAACDFVYTVPETVFSLSEVRIGIVPACIAPFVVKRIGQVRAKELMLTGERINGLYAEKIGLANRAIEASEMTSFVEGKIKFLKEAGPKAIEMCKDLIHRIVDMNQEHAKVYTAKLITELRLSEEGQEGMTAFLEKRKPAWCK